MHKAHSQCHKPARRKRMNKEAPLTLCLPIFKEKMYSFVPAGAVGSVAYWFTDLCVHPAEHELSWSGTLPQLNNRRQF